MTRRENRAPEGLAAILQRILPHGELRALALLKFLREHWAGILPGPAGSASRPMKIEKDRLWVLVGSPVWSSEIGLARQDIIERIRSRSPYPEVRITDIRCRVGQTNARKKQ